MFAELAGCSQYVASARGLRRDAGDVFCAVVQITQEKRTTGVLRLTFDIRIWTRWMRSFLADVSDFERQYGYPPLRYWYDRSDTSDWGFRWDNSFWLGGMAQWPEWVELTSPDDLSPTEALVRSVIGERWIPLLDEYSAPGRLVEFWMSTYDPPRAGLAELRKAAVVAHGLGDHATRDTALDRLDSLAATYPWHANGAEFAAQVRRWISKSRA